jgi:hypothetical protein
MSSHLIRKVITVDGIAISSSSSSSSSSMLTTSVCSLLLLFGSIVCCETSCVVSSKSSSIRSTDSCAEGVKRTARFDGGGGAEANSFRAFCFARRSHATSDSSSDELSLTAEDGFGFSD